MPAHPKPAPKAKKPSGLNRANAAAKATRAAAKTPKPKALMTAAEVAERVKAREATALKGHGPARKPVKAPKPVATVKPKPESGTKTDLVVHMLHRPGGATSKELEAATGWASHSVRGLLGTMRKKGVNVVSKKFPGEPVAYCIIAVDLVGDVV